MNLLNFYRISRFLCMLLACYASTGHAELVLDDSVKAVDLTEHIQFFEDTSNQLTVDNIETEYRDLFAPYGKRQINEGYSNSTWWFRFSLYNNEQAPIFRWLDVAFSVLDEVSVYAVNLENGATSLIGETGDTHPIATRTVPTNTFLFPLNLQPQQQYHYLIKIRSAGSIIVPVALYDEQSFLNHFANQRILLGIYHGGAFFLMLYNIGLLIAVRERLYFYYVMYVLTFLLVSTSLTGLGFEYLWTDQFIVQSSGTPIFVLSCIAFGILFSRNLLALKERAPILQTISNALLGMVAFLICISFFTGYTLGVQLAIIATIICVLFGFVAGIHGLMHHFAPARIYMVAWISLLTGSVVYGLTAASIVTSNLISLNSLQIGSALELLLLSLALGDRITLLKQQKQAVQSYANAQQFANQAKSTFLAAMSHEIRTPMAGVLGMTELMANTNLTHEQKQYMDNIKDSSQSLLDIINQILDLSKIESRKLVLEAIDFGLESVIDESLKVFYSKRQHSPVRFELLLDPATPTQLHGDPTRLRQILINLIGNAYKFTEMGRITLTVRPDIQPDNIHFSVSDTGPGISSSAQKSIFEHYIQEDSSTTRIHGGTGLGLSITRQLVQLMGGEIDVQSQLGDGTTFWFRLPIATCKTAPPLLPATQHSSVHLYLFTNDKHLQRQLGLWCKHMAIDLVLNRWPNATEKIENIVILADDIVQLRQSISILACKVSTHLLVQRHSDSEQREFPCTELPLLPSQFTDILAQRDNVVSAETVIPDTLPRHISIRTVLLAEDNPVNAQVIKGLLKRLEIECDWCQNGKEALEKIRLKPYDLVFMDCEMPVLNGYEATRQIRESGNSRIIIIALTAHAIKEYVDQAYAAGMNDYLTKPIDLNTLRKSLQYWSTQTEEVTPLPISRAR